MKPGPITIVIFSIFLLMMVASGEEGEGNVSGPELVWSKIYGARMVDRVTCIAPSMDGGFVVGHTRRSSIDLGIDIAADIVHWVGSSPVEAGG